MAEPTSILTFNDLILEVAEKVGIAYYGASGTSAAAIPVDAADLALAKRIVNNAIRMFIADGPSPNGWRWTRPIATLDLWASVSDDSGNLVTTAVFGSGVTTVTVADAGSFYQSMKYKTISFDNGATSFPIASVTSDTVLVVTGDASAHVGDTWAIEADGNYTLPDGFSGQFIGHPTFVAGTNRGLGLDWVDESVIRERRSNAETESGTPFLVAIRPMASGSPRRGWELLAWPQPSEYFGMDYSYHLHFSTLTALTDVQPAPFSHDETVLAACRAKAEHEIEDTHGIDWDYYRSTCLPNSYRVDALSAPKKLGYFANPSTSAQSRIGIETFRNNVYNRPDVTFNP